MTTYPVFSIDSCTYDKLAATTRVFNIEEFEYFLYVKVDPSIAKCFEMYQLDDITDAAKPVCHKLLWEHTKHSIWYKFKSGMLNKDPGYHVYRMHMVNTCTNDVLSLYFGYTVQTNTPERPYYYMEKYREGACAAGCSKSTV